MVVAPRLDPAIGLAAPYLLQVDERARQLDLDGLVLALRGLDDDLDLVRDRVHFAWPGLKIVHKSTRQNGKKKKQDTLSQIQ